MAKEDIIQGFEAETLKEKNIDKFIEFLNNIINKNENILAISSTVKNFNVNDINTVKSAVESTINNYKQGNYLPILTSTLSPSNWMSNLKLSYKVTTSICTAAYNWRSINAIYEDYIAINPVINSPGFTRDLLSSPKIYKFLSNQDNILNLKVLIKKLSNDDTLKTALELAGINLNANQIIGAVNLISRISSNAQKSPEVLEVIQGIFSGKSPDIQKIFNIAFNLAPSEELSIFISYFTSQNKSADRGQNDPSKGLLNLMNPVLPEQVRNVLNANSQNCFQLIYNVLLFARTNSDIKNNSGFLNSAKQYFTNPSNLNTLFEFLPHLTKLLNNSKIEADIKQILANKKNLSKLFEEYLPKELSKVVEPSSEEIVNIIFAFSKFSQENPTFLSSTRNLLTSGFTAQGLIDLLPHITKLLATPEIDENLQNIFSKEAGISKLLKSYLPEAYANIISSNLKATLDILLDFSLNLQEDLELQAKIKSQDHSKGKSQRETNTLNFIVLLQDILKNPSSKNILTLTPQLIHNLEKSKIIDYAKLKLSTSDLKVIAASYLRSRSKNKGLSDNEILTEYINNNLKSLMIPIKVDSVFINYLEKYTPELLAIGMHFLKGELSFKKVSPIAAKLIFNKEFAHIVSKIASQTIEEKVGCILASVIPAGFLKAMKAEYFKKSLSLNAGDPEIKPNVLISYMVKKLNFTGITLKESISLSGKSLEGYDFSKSKIKFDFNNATIKNCKFDNFKFDGYEKLDLTQTKLDHKSFESIKKAYENYCEINRKPCQIIQPETLLDTKLLKSSNIKELKNPIIKKGITSKFKQHKAPKGANASALRPIKLINKSKKLTSKKLTRIKNNITGNTSISKLNGVSPVSKTIEKRSVKKLDL